MSKRRSRKTVGKKRQGGRDLERVEELRDGRKNRAATFIDRRREASRNACRSQRRSPNDE